jgi:non-specific serine/threonine protein kinase
MKIESGARLIQMMEPLLCQARQTLSDSLGAATLSAEMDEGRQMTPGQAIAYAVPGNALEQPAKPTKRAASPVSKREIEIARLVATGLSNKEIAVRCFLSERTVETHVSNILNKLGLNSRVDVARWVAQELGED